MKSKWLSTQKKRVFKRILLSGTLCLILSTASDQKASAFSGEDPIDGNPWYHEQLSHKAAIANGFSDSKTAGAGASAAETVAWHADYVDSYLYNPLWWAQGRIPRLRVSLMTAPELEKLHFDDLFAAPKVHDTWQRYTLGTFGGLMWAKEHNDVAAAQNIVGTSLHAMQDFYSHPNWIDAPARRELTYFGMDPKVREQQAIYTGAYELSENLGVKHHGKFLPSAIIWAQPGVDTVGQGGQQNQRFRAQNDRWPRRPRRR